ncbi:MAG: hypothetical protein FWC41_11125, partial [Firmicutes bacterium]|nr:hypothetical protein [Bacillota bacterium]
KKTTCGSYPEFHYHQDNQDGGWTYVSNNIGATYADGNKNMEWRFCVVPGDYNRTGPTPYDMGIYSTLRKFGGGVLLLSIYHWTSADGVVHVYRRYHDDEDSGNANKITSSGGLIKYPGDYIGASLFSNNTGLTWIFAGDANDKHTGLGFDYGVIAWSTSSANTIIGIDDENTKNKNWAKWTRHTTSATPDFEWDDQNFAGIVLGNNNTYYYVKYF